MAEDSELSADSAPHAVGDDTTEAAPPRIDHGPAAREVVRILDGIADDDLERPTPCTDTSVARMLDHVMGLTLAFTWAARKTPPPRGDDAPRPGSSSADNLDPEWRTILPARLDELVDAWQEPTAIDGVTEAGGVTMPAAVTAAVALDELVLHGWDLARATGQSFSCDPVSTAIVLGFTTEAAKPENAGQREGLFGPVVDVPAEASEFDRALGLAGRDPGWTPPA